MSTDSPAVKMYRDRFKLNCNAGRKRDIEDTVTDLELWEYALNSWGYWKAGKWKTFNPLSIGKLLSEYERLSRTDWKSSKRSNVQESVQVGLPERRDSDMSPVSKREGIEPRASSKALDDLLAQALFRMQSTG